MRVHLLDPSAFTPPYDRALAAALARAGAEVELVTSHFRYGPVPEPEGYTASEDFYARSSRMAGRGRMAVKLAEHVPDMLRYRRRAREADLVHWQWLTVQPLDVHLLPPGPRLLTAHDVLPREPRPGQLSATRRLLQRMDAVIVHSRHGEARLRELGVEHVHVIPHGAFSHLARDPGTVALPPELAAVRKPVVLCFGLMRPYKGIDVLLEAWREIADAELWIVGMPRMDIDPLVRAAPPGVRFVPRFVTDAEIPAFFRRADLVVLPYREIDQSGVLYTALAFGRPLLVTAVGGFPEVAEHGAARLVPPGDAEALGAALRDLLAAPEEREALGRAAAAAAAGPYSWDAVAERTIALYRDLLR